MELRIEKALGMADFALEALWALPLALGDCLDGRVKAEGVESLVADVTIKKVCLLSSR